MINKYQTHHAKQRMQQRAISQLQIELIEAFGDDHYQKGGSYYCYIPKKRLKELRRAIDGLENIKAVKGDADKLITAMHGDRKVRTTEYVA